MQAEKNIAIRTWLKWKWYINPEVTQAEFGALVCCLLSLLSSVLAHTMIYSPWVIYFSIIATQWLVRFIKMKRKSDLVLTVLFFVLSILAFVGFVSHLLEVRI